MSRSVVSVSAEDVNDEVRGCRNPGGVRFGSAELYDVVELAFKPSDSLPAQHVISDCLAVGQKIAGGTDERVILFVKLEGERCSEELVKKIKTEIRARRSARHVPERVSDSCETAGRESRN